MRVTSKGQVTIPKEVRDKLGIAPGDEVGFREQGDAVMLEKTTAPTDETDGKRMVRLMSDFGKRMRQEGKVDPYFANMTTDEIMEFLRGYSEDEHDPGFKRPA